MKKIFFLDTLLAVAAFGATVFLIWELGRLAVHVEALAIHYFKQ